jgi:hypothetical protein
MLDAAARRVRKYHPDVTGLTAGERKYMRRIIPFYTWFRGVAPIVLADLARQPAKITALPKVYFNVATSMGVNPYTLTDPFPEDQLIPSFIRDNLTGPVFGDNASSVEMFEKTCGIW